MRTLVTGGAGFIGSHLVERLVAQGDHVVVIDNMSTGKPDNLAGVDQTKITVITDDLLTASDATLDLAIGGIDRVFHLASVVGVRLYVEQPVLTIHSIMKATERIITRLVDRADVPFLLTSTSEAYGRSTDVPMREHGDLLFGPPSKPRWSYGLAKALDEQLVLGYAGMHDLQVKVARLFNVVGPRQTGAYGMVMPRFVGQAINGDPVTVYGDGEQTRTFCHVSDVVTALVRMMETPSTDGKVMNIGSDNEVTINELAERVIKITGSSSEVVHIEYQDAYGDGYEDIRRRCPDVSQARALIDFKLTRGLNNTIRSIVLSKMAEKAAVEGVMA